MLFQIISDFDEFTQGSGARKWPKGEQASEAEVIELNAIVESVGLKEKDLQDKLIQSQSRFASEHQFEFSADGE